jgi:hypothetical protein
MNLANVSQGIVSLAVGLVALLGGRALLDKSGRPTLLQLLGIFLGVAGTTLMLASLPTGWVSSNVQLMIVTIVFFLASFMTMWNSGKKKAGFAVGIFLVVLATIALFVEAGSYYQWIPSGALRDLVDAGVRSLQGILDAVGKVIH